MKKKWGYTQLVSNLGERVTDLKKILSWPFIVSTVWLGIQSSCSQIVLITSFLERAKTRLIFHYETCIWNKFSIIKYHFPFPTSLTPCPSPPLSSPSPLKIKLHGYVFLWPLYILWFMLSFIGEMRNDLYITVERGEFEKGGKSVARNVEVTMHVVDSCGQILKVFHSFYFPLDRCWYLYSHFLEDMYFHSIQWNCLRNKELLCLNHIVLNYL